MLAPELTRLQAGNPAWRHRRRRPRQGRGAGVLMSNCEEPSVSRRTDDRRRSPKPEWPRPSCRGKGDRGAGACARARDGDAQRDEDWCERIPAWMQSWGTETETKRTNRQEALDREARSNGHKRRVNREDFGPARSDPGRRQRRRSNRQAPLPPDGANGGADYPRRRRPVTVGCVAGPGASVDWDLDTVLGLFRAGRATAGQRQPPRRSCR